MKQKMNNSVRIFGYLHDINLKKNTVKNEQSENYGTEFWNGSIDVQTDEEGLNVLTVHFTYVVPTFKKSGKPNRTFDVLEKLVADNKTVLTVGKENAAKIKVDGSVGLNDFYKLNEMTNEIELVSAKRIEASFVSIVNEFEENAYPMDIDFLVTGVRRVEETENDCEHIVIKGATFAYGGKILPLELRAEGNDAMDFFESLEASDTNPAFLEVFGEILNQTIVKEVEVEMAFGEPMINKVKRNVKKWLVTKAKSPYVFDDETTITVDELKQALSDRAIYLAEQKQRYEDYRKQRENGNVAFGGGTVTPKKEAFDFGNF